MSVLRIPVHVTRTRAAPTLMILLAVLAEKDSNGMEYLVKVLLCENALILYQFGTRKHPS